MYLQCTCQVHHPLSPVSRGEECREGSKDWFTSLRGGRSSDKNLLLQQARVWAIIRFWDHWRSFWIGVHFSGWVYHSAHCYYAHANQGRRASQVLWFGNNKELVIEESWDLSPEVAHPQENKQPILIHVDSSPSWMASPICSSPHCIHQSGKLKASSFHPYVCPSTFIGMPFNLPSTKALWHNLNWHKHGCYCTAALSWSRSETSSSNWFTDHLGHLGARVAAECLERYSVGAVSLSDCVGRGSGMSSDVGTLWGEFRRKSPEAWDEEEWFWGIG